MNRPWTACAVMLITLGGTLLAVGSANQPITLQHQSAVRPMAADQGVFFCDVSSTRANPRFQDACGYDRSTGTRYPKPASSSVWSMVAELRFATTMELLRSLKPASDDSPAWHPEWPWQATRLDIAHPSVPTFFSDRAQREYAAAQGRAWRDSSQPLMLRTVQAAEPTPLLRLELCPSKTSFSWGLGNTAVHLNSLVRAIRRYPAEHNVKITILAVQNRTTHWVEQWTSSAETQIASGNRGEYLKSAKAMGFEPGEYEELVDRALEKLPSPDKIESPPHFRPAPSRQKLLRMASSTLLRMSDLLDATAASLERAAGGEVATRRQWQGNR